MEEETNLSKIVKNIKFNSHKRIHKYDNGIVCAGGIIYDINCDKILVVQGQEKWSLPKGHREFGEKTHETAMREIYEETSLKIRIDEKCRSKRVLKSIYYLISFNNNDSTKLTPIDTNEIKCVRWCNKEELYSLDCNKQLKYIVRKWDSVVNHFNIKARFV